MDLNRLGRGIYGNAFARIYGLDDINAVPTLAPEIMPTSSLDAREELWELVGGKHCACMGTVAAGGAGQYGQVILQNPTGTQSRLLGIVERLILSTAGEWQWQAFIGGVGTANLFPVMCDTRTMLNTTDSGGITVFTGTTGLFLGNAGMAVVSGTTPCIIPVHFVISPGNRFALRGPNNTAISFTVEWRERQASPAELELR